MQGRGDLGDHLHADEDRQHEDRQPDDGFSVQLLAPLAADRALNPPTSSSLADQRRVRSLLLSTAARDPGFTCSLPSLRIAPPPFVVPPTPTPLLPPRRAPLAADRL